MGGGRSKIKRAAILAAGTQVFLEHGYRGASMDAVAAKAGVAKQTVYAHFSRKDELFEAIVADVCEHVLAPIETPQGSGSVESTLLSLAKRFLDFAMSPTIVELHRVVTFEAPNFPDIGRTYYLAGIDRAIEVVATYLADQTRRGDLSVSNPRAAAEHFYGMISVMPYLHSLLGIRPVFSGRNRDAYLRQAVATFLEGCRSGRKRRPRGR